MIPIALLDWVVRSLSFFNTIALLWLGLAVLLNAERRRWGTLLAGGGLVLGGIFFAMHTTIVSREFGTFDAEMELWWQLGWLPFVSPPYIWYVVMAWYAAVLDSRLHRAAVAMLGIVGLWALWVIVFVDPLPGYTELLYDRHHAAVELGGVPAVVVLYPAYSAACIILALMALRRPAASQRFMGDIARMRARPWLVAASVVLLVVSLVVGAVAAWVVRGVQSGDLVLAHETITLLKGFDLAFSSLLAVVVVLTGRAVVSYEVFTGKVLPRGGLYGQWRNSLILAASFGGVMSASLELPVAPVFHLMFATVLITALFALHSWRVYADRETSIARLRPFVASERLYERLLTNGKADPSRTAPDEEARDRFAALCRDVLGARVAYLGALGPLAPLAGPPLVFPPGVVLPAQVIPLLGSLAGRFDSPRTMCVAIEPDSAAGAVWAVPLWSERGLVGAMLLGPKVDDGLYTQEEIEIARSTGERLVDTRASTEMARRLMALQRQRLMESQIVDTRARRTLHDEILPRLHAALLSLGASIQRSVGSVDRSASGVALAEDPVAEAVAQIADVHREISSLLRAMPPTITPRLAEVGLLGALRQVIEGELAGSFDTVAWAITADAGRSARSLPPLSAEVVFGAAREAVRNAARYGRAEAGRPLNLTVTATADRARLTLRIEDDGIGIGTGQVVPAAADGIEDAGPALAERTGQGLALHTTLMAVIGGTLTAEPRFGGGTLVTLSLPMSLGPSVADERLADHSDAPGSFPSREKSSPA